MGITPDADIILRAKNKLTSPLGETMAESSQELTFTAKQKESEQIRADIEAFIAAGGVIQELPPAQVKQIGTVSVKKSTE